MSELLFKDESYAIVGAAIEVHRELGAGFLEPVYQEALEVELAAREIPFEAQKRLDIHYKGQPLNKTYIADFVCYNQIIVEIKAQDCLTGIDEAQIINYLKASTLQLGILINFGSPGRLEQKRLIRQSNRP
jgi:GxxExxY protein